MMVMNVIVGSVKMTMFRIHLFTLFVRCSYFILPKSRTKILFAEAMVDFYNKAKER